MHTSYEDILSRIAEAPAWFDENGTPRYGAFSTSNLADRYASEAALVEIACAGCDTRFNVAFSRSPMDDALVRARGGTVRSLADAVRSNAVSYGDPPNMGCCASGPTMMSDAVRVVEFWRREKFDWERAADLEIVLDPEAARR